MSGRHAFSAASNALSDSKVRTAAAAIAAGAMLSAAFPALATSNESSGAQALVHIVSTIPRPSPAAPNGGI